jgi:hypothetical protein
MGIMNRLEQEIAEQLGVSPAQLLEQLNRDIRGREAVERINHMNMLVEEWEEHTTLHVGHPSVNCSFCVQDADEPDTGVNEEEEYAKTAESEANA